MTAVLDAWNSEEASDPYADLTPEERAVRDAALSDSVDGGELGAVFEFIEAGVDDPHSSIGRRGVLLEELAAFIDWLQDPAVWEPERRPK